MPTRSTLLLLGAIAAGVSLYALLDAVLVGLPLLHGGLSLAVTLVASVLAARAIKAPPGVTIGFVLVALAAGAAALSTTSTVAGLLRGTEPVVVRATSWVDVGLVRLERSGPTLDTDATEPLPEPTTSARHRKGDRVWIDTAHVDAVLPQPSAKERNLEAASVTATGLAGVVVLLGAAVLLLGLARHDPFHPLTVRVLVAVGVGLAILLPAAAFADALLVSSALDREWIGAPPTGASTSLLSPIPALAALTLAALLRSGAKLREDEALTV